MSKHKNEFKPQSTPRERYQDAIRRLLDDLCSNGGFCGDGRYAPFDRDCLSWTAEEFAREVLRAEGMDPTDGWAKQLREIFTARFGGSLCVADFESHEEARRLALYGTVDLSARAPLPKRRDEY